MTGIICAMEIEAARILAASTVISEERALGTLYCRAEIGGVPIIVVVCGIGKALAAAATQRLIDRYAVTSVINTGVAGALAPGVSVGDIIIASSLVQHDADTTAIGDPPGLVSGWDIIDIPTNREMSDELKSAAEAEKIPCRIAKIATGDQFIASSERKAQIIATFDAAACEMEGAAVALVCHINAVPCAVVRCISDGEGEVMDYQKFKHFAADRSARVIINYIAKKNK